MPISFGVDTNAFIFSSSSSTRSVIVSSGTKWEVSSMPEWISIQSIASSLISPYEWTVSFSATEDNEYDRDGVIIFKAGSDSAEISVTQVGKKGRYVSVESVSVSPKELTLTEGDKTSLTYSISPTNASIQDVKWESSSPSVATISQSGLVEAIAEGTTLITVTTVDGNKTAPCLVTVKAKVIPVTGVSLNKTSLTMTEGDVQQLFATVTPSDATDKSVTWISSNTSVASVSSSGVITAKAAGYATITVKTTDGAKTASCSVTVEKDQTKATSLSFAGNSLFVGSGDSYSLRVSVSPEDAVCNLSWRSSNTSAVSVYSSGDTATISSNYSSTGYTTVTVTDQRTGLSASIKVYSFIENFAWNESTGDTYSGYPLITIAPGGKYQLKYTSSAGSNVLNLFGNPTQSFVFYEPTYVVDTPANISISPEGLVTGIKNGTTGIKPTGLIQGGGDRIYIRVASSLTESEYNDSKDYSNTVPYGLPMVFSLANTSDVDWFKLMMNPSAGYVSATISVEYSGTSSLEGSEARLCKYSLYDSSMQQWGSGSFSFSSTQSTASTTRSVPAGPLFLKVYFDSSYDSRLCPQYSMTLRMEVN